jgi:Icc-related predicted phosphoesterase
VRILHVSDLHYSLPQLDWVVNVAPSFDLVVVAGDSLNIASAVALEAQSVVVLRYLSMLQAAGKVIVSSGNHDLTGPDGEGEQTALWLSDARSAGIPTDGDSLFLDGTSITICPWWDGPAGRDRVAAQLAVDATRRHSRWIWIYHWPPLGSPTCWTGSRDYGDADLVHWIDEFRPEIVLTGHVHQSPFKPEGSWVDRINGTWVFNAGHQIGPVPAHIVLDLDRGHALWESLMGSEEVRLSDGAAPARTVFS